ncbi:MAG: transposase family protein [Acidimicrobiales bacterium]
MFARDIVKQVAPGMLCPGRLVSDAESLEEFLQEGHGVVVLKAIDGPPVRILDASAARAWRQFPALIERFTPGVDFSLYFFVHGKTVRFPGIVLDYPFLRPLGYEKTGGMGALYSPGVPAPITGVDVRRCTELLRAVLRSMDAGGCRYQGVLVGQFRRAPGRVYFTEFDVKPGDPEFSAVLAAMAAPLGSLIHPCVPPPKRIRMRRVTTAAVAFAPPGYPDRAAADAERLSAPFVEADRANLLIGDVRVRGGQYICGTSRTAVAIGAGRSPKEALAEALEGNEDLADSFLFRSDIALTDRTFEHGHYFERDQRGIRAYGLREPRACPTCGKRDLVHFGSRWRVVKDIPIDGAPTTVRVCTRRYRCRQCAHTFFERPPGVDGKRSMTLRLGQWIAHEACATPVLRIAREVGLTEGAIRALLRAQSRKAD